MRCCGREAPPRDSLAHVTDDAPRHARPACGEADVTRHRRSVGGDAPVTDKPDGSRDRSGGVAGQLLRDLADGVVEIVLTATAVVVLVGAPAWLGHALGGGTGLVVGGVGGAAALCTVWTLLVVAGARDAWRRLRRPRPRARADHAS